MTLHLFLPAIGSTLAQTPPPWLSVDIVDALRDTDLMGKLCLLILALFSILSWAVIAFKLLHIRQAHWQTRQFNKLCGASGSLNDAFQHARAFPDSPLAQIAKETYLELELEDWYRAAAAVSASHRLEIAKLSLERVHERTISQETRALSTWLTFLATTASVCPFIGLFGTVWGVLAVFQGLAAQGTASLQAIAPGIATALTTTVAGLMAAIPAVVSYNYLATSIEDLSSRMEAFAMELSSIAQKRVLED